MADESKGERRSDGGTAGASADPAALTTDAHALQIADMMRAIRENGRPLVDGKEARHPIAIIRAIYQSAEQHREVLVP